MCTRKISILGSHGGCGSPSMASHPRIWSGQSHNTLISSLRSVIATPPCVLPMGRARRLMRSGCGRRSARLARKRSTSTPIPSSRSRVARRQSNSATSGAHGADASRDTLSPPRVRVARGAPIGFMTPERRRPREYGLTARIVVTLKTRGAYGDARLAGRLHWFSVAVRRRESPMCILIYRHRAMRPFLKD